MKERQARPGIVGRLVSTGTVPQLMGERAKFWQIVSPVIEIPVRTWGKYPSIFATTL